MEVYIEYVILDNFVIDYIILYLTLFSLKQKISHLNLILSSIVGTLFAVFMPFITLSSIALFFIKLGVGLIMILFISKKELKWIALNYFLFLSYTFLMGGLCFGLMCLLFGTISLNGIIMYQFQMPIGLIFLVLFIYFLFIKKMVAHKRKFGTYTYAVEIYKEDKSMQLVGFLDTGNQMYDKSGNPILIISQKTFMKAYSSISYLKILNNKVNEYDIAGSEYLTMTTASDVHKMLTFKADLCKIQLDHKTKILKNVTIGVANSNFNQKFDCILHHEFFFS